MIPIQLWNTNAKISLPSFKVPQRQVCWVLHDQMKYSGSITHFDSVIQSLEASAQGIPAASTRDSAWWAFNFTLHAKPVIFSSALTANGCKVTIPQAIKQYISCPKPCYTVSWKHRDVKILSEQPIESSRCQNLHDRETCLGKRIQQDCLPKYEQLPKSTVKVP